MGAESVSWWTCGLGAERASAEPTGGGQRKDGRDMVENQHMAGMTGGFGAWS